ncbi:hypothetical protein PYR77_00215 [Acinetobacter soli]|nr:hypothetical protein [Acinetobacter soli]WEH92059.1 hypothetical protein PYR75_16375 [Acinetobacter soli]WEI00608.1 hypothetical protein PYR77_00215 [Acinetobacter soli]
MVGLLRSVMSRFDDSLEIAGAVAGVLAGLELIPSDDVAVFIGGVDVAAEVLDVELYVSTLPCFFAPLGGGVLV